ncbi:RHS repeat-associated core domain-containing protein [Luteibacter sp. 22Crub2.1]|uniref:RHS repeat-associated core domain-containing protein n=1 Tax=Luteibacter sp. 22Crub2.1 TaxID=1283288 RepID=UPI0009A64818|nr:RHS repeat-associated core domain-containing protein [Luteibacter sp. 22Crub2.1]SKB49883.1 RHS repeat-associated core domain-containing protein [Luteibacter sp. 22Crub2.1]
MTTRRARPWASLVLALGMGPVAADETVTYYYTSPQGSVLATADASGHLLNTVDYRPYGGQALGSPADGPGYAGHVQDVDTALVYMQARYYDPQTGRFLSVDPAPGKAADLFVFNRYAYGNNNPVRNIDPDGRATFAIGGTLNASALAGGTVTGQLTFSATSWSPSTWRVGGYGSAGGVASTDVGTGGGLVLSYSPADSAEEMAAASSNGAAGGAVNLFGASLGYERSLCTDCKAVQSVTFGTRLTVAPVEIHTSVTQSGGMTWLGSNPVQPTVTVGPATTAPPPLPLPPNPRPNDPRPNQRESLQ